MALPLANFLTEKSSYGLDKPMNIAPAKTFGAAIVGTGVVVVRATVKTKTIRRFVKQMAVVKTAAREAHYTIMLRGTPRNVQAERRREIEVHALSVFENNAESAQAWLRTPALYLDGRRPIDMTDAEENTKKVHTLLTRIEYGVYT